MINFILNMQKMVDKIIEAERKNKGKKNHHNSSYSIMCPNSHNHSK